MKKFIPFLLCFLSIQLSFAQSLSSISQNNLSGIYQNLQNPAEAVGGIDWLSINLIGVGTQVNNNVFRSNLEHSIGEIALLIPYFKDEAEFKPPYYSTPRKNVRFPNAYANADALQLGVSGAINKKVSFFVFTRERAFANIDKTSFKSIKLLFDEGRDVVNQDQVTFDARSMGYQEIGLGGAFQVYSKRKNHLNIGITYKFLNGRFIYGASLPDFEAIQSNDRVNLKSTLNFLETTLDFATQNPIDFITKPRVGKGKSIDFGIVYEHRPYSLRHTFRKNNPKKRSKNFNQRDRVKYDFKLGISLLDLGNITYNGDAVSNTTYNLDASFNLDILRAMSLPEVRTTFLDSAVVANRTNTATINLPTTLNINYDQRLYNNWFFSANYVQNIVKNDFGAVYVPSNLQVQFRKENNKCVFAIPMKFIPKTRTYTLGGLVQVGPFFLGTDNLSTLLVKKTYNPSIFTGFFYNIRYKKDKTIENYRSFRTRKAPRYKARF